MLATKNIIIAFKQQQSDPRAIECDSSFEHFNIFVRKLTLLMDLPSKTTVWIGDGMSKIFIKGCVNGSFYCGNYFFHLQTLKRVVMKSKYKQDMCMIRRKYPHTYTARPLLLLLRSQ